MRFYFDHNASTPVHPQVFATFVECAREIPGNASSIHHFGQLAKQKLEGARRKIAARVGVTPREIVFTSGGTESDNLGLIGVVRASKNSRKHVITTQIEHPAVLSTCGYLGRDGVAVTYLPVGGTGIVDPDEVRRAIRPETVLVSVMHANNETGAIQPIEQIATITREAGVLFHSDGAQAAGRIPVHLPSLGVDLYSISAHKMNAPKGAGALWVREKTPIEAMQFGGHHERERRAGTENVPAIAAFGMAASLGCDPVAIAELRDRFEQGVLASVPGSLVNAGQSRRLPNTSNVRFPGVSGEAMVIGLDLAGFAVSSGAACSSGSIEPSHVLLAMGLNEARAKVSVRFSMGLGNTAEQVDALIEAVATTASRIGSGTATIRRKAQHA